MSVSKWAYTPEKCDGDFCPNDCDHCSKRWKDDLPSELRTASKAAKMTNNPTWATLMERAADVIDQTEKQARKLELDAFAMQLERNEYLRQARELANAWTNALTKVREWIPVTERVPDRKVHCLVSNGRDVCPAVYRTEVCQFVGIATKGVLCDVRYWMYLPDPPKEET